MMYLSSAWWCWKTIPLFKKYLQVYSNVAGIHKSVKVYIFKNPEMFVRSVSIDWNYLLCYLEQTFVSVEERNLSNDNFNRNIRQRNIVTLEIFMMKVCLRDVTLIFLHYVLHLSAKTRILPQWEKACSALVKRQ